MTLRRSLRVLSPCELNYDEMRAHGAQERFCESCEKSVHELRSRADAERALAVANTPGQSICVRYPVDVDGNPVLPRRRRRTMVVPSSALAMALAASVGCTPKQGRAPNLIYAQQCVYDSPIYHFTLARGEGNCPAVEPEVDKVEIDYDDPVVPFAELGTPTPKDDTRFGDTGVFTVSLLMGVLEASDDGLRPLDLYGEGNGDAIDIDAILEVPEPQARVRMGRMTVEDQPAEG